MTGCSTRGAALQDRNAEEIRKAEAEAEGGLGVEAEETDGVGDEAGEESFEEKVFRLFFFFQACSMSH